MKTENKKEIFSWVMYDWANSAFATTIAAVVLPIFYQDVAAGNLPDHIATAYWGYTLSIAMAILVILSPILGSIADCSGSKKRYLMTMAFLGMAATAALTMVGSGQYMLASAIYIVALIGFGGGNVFYDAFLPEIVPEEQRNYVSSRGFAYGYLGGGILLAVNLLMIQFPKLFGMKDAMMATKVCFITVSVWWFVFSIPLIKNLKERRSSDENDIKRGTNYIKAGLGNLVNTFKNITNYKELFKFLIAFWLYNDAIGTIIGMATIYGRELGIPQTSLMGALLLTQLAGFPFTLLMGRWAYKLGTKKSLYICLSIYALICLAGYMMTTQIHFWILAFMVALVQGASQALSRSLFSSLVPVKHSAEFFGFYSVFNKLSDILGPFVFAIVAYYTGNSRNGIFSLILFIIIGGLILRTVNVEEGRKQVSVSMALQPE